MYSTKAAYDECEDIAINKFIEPIIDRYIMISMLEFPISFYLVKNYYIEINKNVQHYADI